MHIDMSSPVCLCPSLLPSWNVYEFCEYSFKLFHSLWLYTALSYAWDSKYMVNMDKFSFNFALSDLEKLAIVFIYYWFNKLAIHFFSAVSIYVILYMWLIGQKHRLFLLLTNINPVFRTEVFPCTSQAFWRIEWFLRYCFYAIFEPFNSKVMKIWTDAKRH